MAARASVCAVARCLTAAAATARRCLPFVPSPAREHVASLRAWNLEVMQTLLKSGASGAGPMRLSWWMNVVATLFKHVRSPLQTCVASLRRPRCVISGKLTSPGDILVALAAMSPNELDVCGAAQGSCPHTPVGRALQDAVVRGGLSQEHFNVYFDRIGMLVADGTPATVAALQRAAEAEGALVKMAMECVCTANGVQGEQGLVEDAWSAAAHVGKAVRITALLKAIPAFAAKKKVYIPKEVCASVSGPLLALAVCSSVYARCVAPFQVGYLRCSVWLRSTACANGHRGVVATPRCVVAGGVRGATDARPVWSDCESIRCAHCRWALT